MSSAEIQQYFARQLTARWRSLSYCLMPNPKAETRLEPIMHAYLEDLAKLGAYGKGKSGVIRGFVERGVQVALEKKVIAPRNADDFKGDDDGENAVS